MANTKKKRKASSSSKWFFWIIGIISVLLVGGLIVLGNTSISSKQVAKIDYSGQPYIGKDTAPVQIVEFGDYKCPVCKTFNETIVPQITKEFVDTGKAKLYFMNYAFISVDSTRAALFSETVYEELGNSTFWRFHDLLYKKQPEDPKYEKMDYFTEAFLTDTLKEVASSDDVNKVVQAFSQNKAQAALDKDMSYVSKLQISGTPSLFINGKKFEGQTFDDLRKMIDDAAKGSK
ncbi:DsbA family protein [Ectobacillus polymachus]|uniref:DsbA family protein n=1 Tax=Ectobacillus polymachus TaxID=1508806 RepID=UPI003A893239